MDAVVVTTVGEGSMDLYGARLAEKLPVPALALDISGASAGRFKRSVAAQISALRGDVAVLRRLRREAALLHLTNHHLARYTLALDAPVVLTVHDLIRQSDVSRSAPYISRPGLGDRLALRLERMGMERAAAIIAPSAATMRDLVSAGIRAERIAVVHHGVDHDLFRAVDRRLVPEPYVLFVGSEHPRKNLVTLFRAFALLKRERRFAAFRLVKVGAPGTAEAPFRERTVALVRELDLEEHVSLTNRVPARDLPAYYSGAHCLVLPSLAEGFGFPALEAMACGCPVIVSNAGALPEVVGTAGIVVPPLDARALAAALAEIISDGGLRAELRERGVRRAAEFTWERAARETMAVYRAVAESRAVEGRYSARRRQGKSRSTASAARPPASQEARRTFLP